MTYRSDSNAEIQIGKEASFGTLAVTPISHVLRHASFTFDGIKEIIKNPILRSDPNPSPSATGTQTVTAQLKTVVTADEFGILCWFFLQGYAVSGAGPFEHLFKISSTNPNSCYIQCGDTELTKYDQFLGLFVKKISLGTITKGSNSFLEVTVDFYASGEYTINSASDLDGTPVEYTDLHHTMPSVSVDVDGTTTAIITDITVDMERDISGLGALDATLFDSDADLRDYMFNVEITGWRDSADTIFGLDDGAEHEVEILSPRPGAATRSVLVGFSECNIYAKGTTGGGAGEPRKSVAMVDPFYTNHADATSLIITVTNDVPTYATIF